MGFFKKFCLLIFFISTSAYSAENINKYEDPQWIVFPWEEWWRKWNPEEQHHD